MNKLVVELSAFLVLLLAFSATVKADADGINMTDLPTQLSASLGVSEFVAQLIASSVLLLLASAITGFCVKKSSAALPIIAIVDFLIMGVCVGLAWLPVWTFTICILLVSLLAAAKWKDAI